MKAKEINTSFNHSQLKIKIMNNTQTNPLLCNPETGICEIPQASDEQNNSNLSAVRKPIRVIYFTDPICSSCWGIEPQLRKLKLEYGEMIDIEYRMGGLLPNWSYNSGGISKPSDVAQHWDEASAHYEMPIDGDVWIEDPLTSSYPPSIAFKAAELQDQEKAVSFMRRMREMLFLEKKNIAKWENMVQAALEAGLDAIQFKKDFEGKANQLFQDDLNLGRKLGVRGFPTMFFTDAFNNQIKVYGSKPYEQYEQALLKLFPAALKKEIDHSPENIFAHFPTLATKEFEVLTNNTKENSEKILNDLLEKGMIESYASKNGILWKKKNSTHIVSPTFRGSHSMSE